MRPFLFAEKGGETDQDVTENFKGFLIAVESGDEFLGIVFEYFRGVFLVDIHSSAKNLGIEVIGSLFDESTPLDPFD